MSIANSFIRELILEDVRCFGGEQKFNIRPLTFLIGENSTGKTTTLAILQILNDFFNGDPLSFNREPYSMGTFKEIVRTSKPKKNHFKISFKIKNTEYFLLCEEKKGFTEPILTEIKMERPNYTLIFQENEDKAKPNNNVEYDEKNKIFKIFYSRAEFYHISFRIRNYLRENENEYKADIIRNIFPLIFFKQRSYSSAPTRFKPKRSYDPVESFKDAEGNDIPMFLRNLYTRDKREWERLKNNLKDFGKTSGLFQDIDIKIANNNTHQIFFKVRGGKKNMIDVGYGVSQVLPLLVRLFVAKRGTQFLIQQPELHLHPKAQVELISLFTKMSKRHSFVLETHSSRYMIDRARIEIMDGNIAPEDVSLIYLEPLKNKVKVHNITFDKQGNFIGVPSSYNSFSFQEGYRALGFRE